ncbi:hypothetical protein [Tabrizicola sp.]
MVIHGETGRLVGFGGLFDITRALTALRDEHVALGSSLAKLGAVQAGA